MSTAALDHAGKKQVTEPHRRQQVELHEAFPVVPRDLVQPPGDTDARVVDQNIRYHASRRTGFSNRLASLLRCKVGGNRGDKVVAGSINNVLQCAIGNIRQYQFRARGTKLTHQLSTEAAAGTGNQDCLVSCIGHEA